MTTQNNRPQNNNQDKGINGLTKEAKFAAKLIAVCGQPLPYFNKFEQVLDKLGVVRPPKKEFYKLYSTLREQGIGRTSMLASRVAEAMKVSVETPDSITASDVLDAVEYIINKPVLSYEEARSKQIDSIIDKLKKSNKEDKENKN